MKWNIRSTIIPATIPKLLHTVLANRDISDIDAFLHPTDPMGLTLKDVGIDTAQMKKAITRLEQARQKKEKIIIFGDYDCDGCGATTVLWETLHELGVGVFPLIPDRTLPGS